MKPAFYDIQRDGITQGLLGKWLECRVKARLFLQGISPKGSSMGLTYGNVVHGILERVYRDIQNQKTSSLPDKARVKRYVADIEKAWHADNTKPDAKSLEHLELSLLIAEATIPIYFEFWNKDLKELKWRSLEEEFKIPLVLPDGRNTVIRGKRDGVYTDAGLRLFETKTKSRMNEDNLIDYIPMELQVNLYLWSLMKELKQLPSGVLYNIVRRIGLEQRKTESIVEFSKRCVDDIRKRPDFYFVRLKISIDKDDIQKFEKQFIGMVTDFYDWHQGKAGHYPNSGACENKYGRCEMLNYCAGYGMAGYTKRDRVFRELEDM